MKFDKDKKQSIVFYILEKISQGEPALSKYISENLNINQTTVHAYINELVDNNIIVRVKRGEYKLNNNNYSYLLKRSDGEFESDIYAFNKYMKPHIKDLPENLKIIWEYSFSEMINNVIDHSGAESVIINIKQNYMETSVFIIDNGIGIFEKIKKYFNLPSLNDAICELFKGKLTTDSENHSGEGIFFTSKIMDKFVIFSDSSVFSHNKYDENLIDENFQDNFKGTAVYMAISNFSHKNAQEIFDAFSNVDGGFTKTTIPLKNIFDSSPVSRSQARRICNHLNKFKEVIIDFDDITWMGQGFAHQLFIVFQREYPDLKLIPINMNESVTKMYNHVKN